MRSPPCHGGGTPCGRIRNFVKKAVRSLPATTEHGPPGFLPSRDPSANPAARRKEPWCRADDGRWGIGALARRHRL